MQGSLGISLNAANLLTFSGMALTATSLGFVLRMQRAVAMCQWDYMNKKDNIVPDAAYRSQVFYVPTISYCCAGIFFFFSTALVLASTINTPWITKHQNLMLLFAFHMDLILMIMLSAITFFNVFLARIIDSYLISKIPFST